MNEVLTWLAFALLTTLFYSGAQESLINPEPTEREIESYLVNAIFDLARALCLGGIVLLVGLALIALG